MLIALLIPARNVRAYGCFEGTVGRMECVQKSIEDGWEHATDHGCLRETSYFCIKVSDHIVSSDRIVKQLVLDHLVHSYNSLEDPNYLEYGYIKVYAEVADYLAQRLPEGQGLRILYVGGGGYTLPRHIEDTYPNARQEIMEIDPGVTQTRVRKAGRRPAHDEHRHLQLRWHG